MYLNISYFFYLVAQKIIFRNEESSLSFERVDFTKYPLGLKM